MIAGALEGIVVVDFSRILAGPYATMMLGDVGADVVKVERPGSGDDTRHWGPPHDSAGVATYFNAVNRNKRSVALDLGDADDLQQARDLVARADIVVENFRPGTMEKLGLGYDDLRAIRPDIIYCSITGFGRGGGATLPGYDLLVQAVGGLMSITGSTPDEPVKVGVALVDVITGLHASVGILAALHERTASGRGQHVAVNLLSSLLSGMVNQSAGYVGAGFVPHIMGNRHPSIAPYESYPTADAPLVIAVGNDRQFRACAKVLGAPDWADDPRFATNPARVEHRDDLYAAMCARLSTAGAEQWFDALSDVGVPAGPIHDIAGAFGLADRLGLEPVATVDGEATVANPIRLGRTPVTYRMAPPALGSTAVDDLGRADPARRA
jgi:crotonobetainyl-CoA:carnitine CoA-transferase CaiB-like acyl-CoA transferase